MQLRALTVAVCSGALSTEVLRQLTAEPQNNITHVATHAQTGRHILESEGLQMRSHRRRTSTISGENSSRLRRACQEKPNY
jgi:hypothetical protein